MRSTVNPLPSPVAVKARFDAGARNPFAPHARHLDLRPRSRAEPFSLSPNPTSGSQAEALAFATAPKLGKDAHVLPDLLTTFTKDLPDALRSKDFEACQQLHGLLFAHETSKFLGNIGEEALKEGGGGRTRSGDPWSASHPMRSSRLSRPSSPMPLTLPLKSGGNYGSKPWLRAKTLPSRLLCKGAALFSATLFDPKNIKQAEDCVRNLPPVFNINMPKAKHSLPFSGGHSSSFRGSPRGRGSFRDSLSSQRGPRSHRGSSRGSYYSQAASSYYQEDGSSYDDRQWRQQQHTTFQVPMLTRKQYHKLLGSINFVAPYIKQGLLNLRQIILTAPNFKSHPSRRSSDLFLHHLQW